MKKVLNIKILLLAIGAFAVPGAAKAASLLEIYQQALQSDPQIHEAEARRLAALEAKPQARSFLLPQVFANGDWTKVDASGSSFEPSIGDTITFDQETDGPSWNFELRQTLFRWDQMVNLRRAAGSDRTRGGTLLRCAGR
jgi:outer membrane protein